MSHEISRSMRIRETSKLVMVSMIINKNIYFSIPSILSFSQKPIMVYSLELSPEVGFRFWLKNNTYPIFFLAVTLDGFIEYVDHFLIDALK